MVPAKSKYTVRTMQITKVPPTYVAENNGVPEHNIGVPRWYATTRIIAP